MTQDKKLEINKAALELAEQLKKNDWFHTVGCSYDEGKLLIYYRDGYEIPDSKSITSFKGFPVTWIKVVVSAGTITVSTEDYVKDLVDAYIEGLTTARAVLNSIPDNREAMLDAFRVKMQERIN